MEELLANPFLNWLLKATWESSVLIVLVLLLQWVFRRQLSPRWRYALWMLVLARMIFPVSIPSSFSVFTYVSPPVARPVERALARIDEPAFHAAPPVVRRTPSASATSVAPTFAGPSVDQVVLRPLPIAAGPARDHGTLGIFMLGMADYSLAAWCMLGLVLVIWPIGVLLMVVRILRQNFGFFRRIRLAPSVTDPAVLQTFEDCQDTLGLQLNIPLFEMDEIKSPGLFGFFRPRLLLPAGLVANYSERELRHIFLHELAHVKRLDMVVNWVMTILQVLHWFNPIIWFGFARMRAERELACDALVLSRSRRGEEEKYGETIVKLLESFVRPAQVPGLLGLLEDKEEMKERITMITVFKKTSRGSLAAFCLIVVLGLAFLTDAKSPTEAERMPSGLVGWWRGEGNGEEVIGAHTAAMKDGPLAFAPGKVGQGFELSGTNAIISVPAAPSLDVGKGTGFTIGVWAKYKDTGVLSSLVEWNVGGEAGVRMFIDDSTLTMDLPPVGTNLVADRLRSREGIVLPGNFYHLVLTYNSESGMAYLYVDGEQEAFGNLGRNKRVTTGDIFFGYHLKKETPRPFTGCLDEIQIFDRDLTPKEIATIFRAGRDNQLVTLASRHE